MTVAGKDSKDSTGTGSKGSNDVDALMAAITGEPVPEEALRDPAFAAEHAAALADVALLKERLTAVGETLASPAAPAQSPGPASRAAPAGSAGSASPDAPAESVVPFRPPRRSRSHAGTALGAVAAAVAAAMVGGLAWLVVDAGPGEGRDAGAGSAKEAAPDGKSRQDGDGGADADLTPQGFVACSRIIVEGTVTAVDAVPGAARDRVTLDVTRYYKPRSGDGTLTFPMDRDVDPRLKAGDRVLITIPRGEAHPDNWATGKDRDSLRRMILKALPGSRKIQCDGGSRTDR